MTATSSSTLTSITTKTWVYISINFVLVHPPTQPPRLAVTNFEFNFNSKYNSNSTISSNLTWAWHSLAQACSIMRFLWYHCIWCKKVLFFIALHSWCLKCWTMFFLWQIFLLFSVAVATPPGGPWQTLPNPFGNFGTPYSSHLFFTWVAMLQFLNVFLLFLLLFFFLLSKNLIKQLLNLIDYFCNKWYQCPYYYQEVLWCHFLFSDPPPHWVLMWLEGLFINFCCKTLHILAHW